MPQGVERTDDTSGLEALVLLLRFNGIAVDPEQIRHQFGGAPIGVTQMLRCAKDLKLKARAVASKTDRLSKFALPAIAERTDGSFFIVGRLVDDKVLIQDPQRRPARAHPARRIRGASGAEGWC